MAEPVRARRLTDEEGQRLLQIVRRGKHGSVRVRRAMIIMASASGTLVPAIARLVAADEDTVRDVIHLFNAKGLAALDPQWAGGPDRLERGQGVVRALVLAGHAPQLVIAEAVAAVEVADAVGAVVGGAQPGRVVARRPAGAVAGPDRQRPELVAGEAAVRVMAGPVLDPGQLGVPVRIAGLFPGPGPLEADAAGVQDLPQPLPANPDRPGTAR